MGDAGWRGVAMAGVLALGACDTAESASPERPGPGAEEAKSEPVVFDGSCPAGPVRELIERGARGDPLAAALALVKGGTLLATNEAYVRIAADFAAIRKTSPGLVSGRVLGPRAATRKLDVHLTPSAAAAFASGDYDGLRSLNECFAVRKMHAFRRKMPIYLEFDITYDGEKLAAAYAAHPDVESARPAAKLGDGDRIRMCGTELGGRHTYIASVGSGDCPAGCIDRSFHGLQVDPDGTLIRLGRWDRNGKVPRPSWVDCKAPFEPTPLPEPDPQPVDGFW